MESDNSDDEFTDAFSELPNDTELDQRDVWQPPNLTEVEESTAIKPFLQNGKGFEQQTVDSDYDGSFVVDQTNTRSTSHTDSTDDVNQPNKKETSELAVVTDVGDHPMEEKHTDVHDETTLLATPIPDEKNDDDNRTNIKETSELAVVTDVGDHPMKEIHTAVDDKTIILATPIYDEKNDNGNQTNIKETAELAVVTDDDVRQIEEKHTVVDEETTPIPDETNDNGNKTNIKETAELAVVTDDGVRQIEEKHTAVDDETTLLATPIPDEKNDKGETTVMVTDNGVRLTKDRHTVVDDQIIPLGIQTPDEQNDIQDLQETNTMDGMTDKGIHPGNDNENFVNKPNVTAAKQIFNEQNEESIQVEVKMGKQNNKDDKCVSNDPDGEWKGLMEFLEKLGLTHFFPCKLGLMDVMKIKKSPKRLKMTDIPFIVLKHIIMMDYNGRDKLIQEYCEKLLHVSGPSTLDVSCSIFGNDENEYNINPLDLMVALIRCSSPALTQILATKLFMCQLAIPFVLPLENGLSPLLVWSLREIHLECNTSGKIFQHIAVECPCHIIGLFRLGRPSISKSRLINEFLSDQYHSFCFNKDSPLGDTNRVISDGLIEVTWYQPSEKQKIFEDVCMFLNLRGDAEKYEPQLGVISRLSSVSIVFVEISKLKDENTKKILENLHRSNEGVIIAVDPGNLNNNIANKDLQIYISSTSSYKEQTRYIPLAKDGQSRSFSLLKRDIRRAISELTKGLKKVTLSTKINKKELDGYPFSDENTQFYDMAKNDAEEIVHLIPENSSKIKETVVPLQGKPWQEWSEMLKNVNKSSQYISLEDENKIKLRMNERRLEQIQLIKENKIQLVSAFVDKYTKRHFANNGTVEFVLYLKSFLDERSRCVLPGFLTTYQTDWKALKIARDNKQKETTETLKAKLDESEHNLAEASFGFEHLLREIGQIYEALVSCKNQNLYSDWTQTLPLIGASLLLKGFPLEIMDGDIANVPMTWVKAVINSLKAMIGEKKCLALSVLGIQSSGKSTLLNTMFGLQFAVSAGRCTRGVFIQLVPVQNGILPFDFVLVIDTEGLRAPELAQHKHTHDNELATFVIGLGDITMVNIKGENTAEMKDVLQIAVHAFLRLKLANNRLNLKQSCVFVHQNVPASDAIDKMMQGRQKLVETLDEMTKEAADQENIADIQSFNQVIDFDGEKDIWYFSDLWQGDPPMAPANPGYSKSVLDVKDAIMFRLTTNRTTYLTVTDTISRIEDLWNGIIKDDFVFSFRNSLELKAYNSMECKFQEMLWEIEKFIFEFVASEGKTRLLNCENSKELEGAVPGIMIELTKVADKKLKEKCQALESFIDTSALKDVMIQWSQSKQNRMHLVCEHLILMAKNDIIKTKEEIKTESLRRNQEKDHEMEINEIARTIANEERGRKPSNKIIKRKFEDMWNSWISKFESKMIEDTVPIRDQIQSVINERYPADAAFMTRKGFDKNQKYFRSLSKLEGSLKVDHISSNEHISIHKYFGIAWGKEDKSVCKKQTISIANTIFQQIDAKLQQLKTLDVRFNLTFVTEILNIIVQNIESHNQHLTNKYNFNLLPPFRVLMVMHVAKYITVVFTRMNERYNQKHSPKAQMETYRKTVWSLFTNVIKSKTEDTIAAGFFKDEISKHVIEHVCSLLPIDVQDKILVAFSHEKYSLMKRIMIELAEKGEFEKVQTYIYDPYTYSYLWLCFYTDKVLFDEKIQNDNVYVYLAKRHVQQIFLQISSSIHKASEGCMGKKRVIVSHWRKCFLKDIRESNIFPIPQDILMHAENICLSDMHGFTTTLKEQMIGMEESVLNFFKSTDKNCIEWKENPIPRIMEKLWGCKENCVFCNEPCKLTDKEHINNFEKYPHQCIQHRCIGINGWHGKQSEKLIVEFCNFLVQSESYKYKSEIDSEYRLYRDYKKEYPNWEIQPTNDTSRYWMWTLCKYENELAEAYGKKLPDIPSSWRDITQAEAIESL